MNLYSRIDLHSQNEPFTSDELAAAADRSQVHSLRSESFVLPVEDRISLYNALDKLTNFQRRLIYLLFFKDLTQHEVASELGLTQKKVSRESIKALTRLRQLHGSQGLLACTVHRPRRHRHMYQDSCGLGRDAGTDSSLQGRPRACVPRQVAPTSKVRKGFCRRRNRLVTLQSGRVVVKASKANHSREWGAKPQGSPSRLGCRRGGFAHFVVCREREAGSMPVPVEEEYSKG